VTITKKNEESPLFSMKFMVYIVSLVVAVMASYYVNTYSFGMRITALEVSNKNFAEQIGELKSDLKVINAQTKDIYNYMLAGR